MSLPRVLSFRGRIGRRTFWLTLLSLLIFTATLNVILNCMALNSANLENGGNGSMLGAAALALGAGVVTIWISLAMQVKRWHDRNKSGWMILIILIPIIGALWSWIELGFLKGAPCSNKYD